MKKKFFEDPEMGVVRFDARDAFIATSGSEGEVDGEEEYQIEPEPEVEPEPEESFLDT